MNYKILPQIRNESTIPMVLTGLKVEDSRDTKASLQTFLQTHSEIPLMCSSLSLVAVLTPLVKAADTLPTSSKSTATFTKDSSILILSTALRMCSASLPCSLRNQPLISLQTQRYLDRHLNSHYITLLLRMTRTLIGEESAV